MMSNDNNNNGGENNRGDMYGEGRNFGNDPIEGLYAYRPERQPYKARRFSIRTILILVIVAMAAIVWYAYPRGADRYQDAELPLVRADNQPYKVLPANRGGMEIPHQDSTIFSAADGLDAGQVETLLPEPEQPMDRQNINVIGAPPENSLVQTPDMKLDVKLSEKAAPPPQRAQLIKVPENTPSGEPAPVREEPDFEQSLDMVLNAPQNEPEVIETIVKEKKTEDVKEASNPETRLRTSFTATHFVQLGAYRSKDDAQSEYAQKQNKYGDIIKGYNVHYKYADLGAKGIYYRLQIGPMAETEAQSVCNRILEITSGGCLVTK